MGARLRRLVGKGIFACGFAALAPGVAAQAPEEPSFLADLHGRLDLRYRYRSVPGIDRDQDLLGSFGTEGVLRGVWEKGMRLRLSGSFVADLDDFPDAGSPLAGLPETFETRLHAYLFEAYGELDPEGALGPVRIGRQVLWREEGIRFDGLRAEGPLSGDARLSFFGGVPVHFYESSRGGDVLAGAGLELRSSRGLRLFLDEIYVRDRRDEPGIPAVEGDLLTALAAELRPHPRWSARGSVSWLDTRDRRQSLEVRVADPAGAWRISARAARQNDFSEIPVTEFSPFVAVLGFHAPYLQWQVDAGAPLGGPADVSVGYASRRLLEGAEEGVFNHAFDQGYGLLSLAPFPFETTSAFLRADAWNAEGRDLVAFGAGGEARLGERREWRLQVGSDFALYRVDLLTGEERSRDRQYYGRLRWRVDNGLDLMAGYRYETDDLGRTHVADLALGVRF